MLFVVCGRALRHSIGAAAFIAVLFGVGVPARAQAPQVSPATDSPELKINLAGRQRMLSQSMTRSACFVKLGVNPLQQRTRIQADAKRFTTTLSHLLRGASEPPLVAEDTEPVRGRLRAVDDRWAQFQPRLQAAIDQETDGDARLQDLLQRSVDLLLAADEATQHLEDKYAVASVLGRGLAQAINIAGRQRMLLHKLGKELCMLRAGIDPTITRSSVLGTVALFESSLARLSARVATLPLQEAGQAEIRASLLAVQPGWSVLKAIADGAVADRPPTTADFRRIDEIVPQLVDTFDQMVQVYRRS